MLARRSAIYLVGVCCFSALSSCEPRSGGKVGSHADDFAALTPWMLQRGFKPCELEPGMILKADPKYASYDYQWYESSYHNSPVFYVFVGFASTGKLEVFSGAPTGPRYQESEKGGKEITDEVQQFLRNRR